MVFEFLDWNCGFWASAIQIRQVFYWIGVLWENEYFMKKEVHRSNWTTVIEAETDLYMATLDKKEYQGIYYTLKRQLNTKMNFYLNDIWTLTDFQPAAMHLDMIDYFLTTPIFSNWKKENIF